MFGYHVIVTKGRKGEKRGIGIESMKRDASKRTWRKTLHSYSIARKKGSILQVVVLVWQKRWLDWVGSPNLGGWKGFTLTEDWCVDQKRADQRSTKKRFLGMHCIQVYVCRWQPLQLVTGTRFTMEVRKQRLRARSTFSICRYIAVGSWPGHWFNSYLEGLKQSFVKEKPLNSSWLIDRIVSELVGVRTASSFVKS